MIVGLLLAGGRSRRFGSEKAVAPYDGGVMMDRPLIALRGVCEIVAVSARTGSGAERHARSRGLKCLIDRPGHAEGPLAGLHAGLTWASDERADLLATAPCDTPGLSPAHYRALLAAIDQGAVAAVSRSPRGLEPLVAVWPVCASRTLVEAALSGGGHPAVHALLEALGAIEVEGFDGWNVNASSDLTG